MTSAVLPLIFASFASNGGGCMAFETRCDRPVLFRLERLDFAFTFDDQSQGDRLNAAGGNAAANLVPEQRADLIAHEPVQNAPRLLRIDDVLIDPAGILTAALIAFGVISLNRTRKISTLSPSRISFRCWQMASPSRSGSAARKILSAVFAAAFSSLMTFSLPGDPHRRLEIIVRIHAQLAFGQILYVAERCLDDVFLAQVLIDCGRFRRRLHDDQ